MVTWLPGGNMVSKYDMSGKGTGGVATKANNKQTLRDISCSQEDGKTIMEVTKLLVKDEDIPILEEGANMFLHARGGTHIGLHASGHLSFRRDFSEDQDVENYTEDISAQSCPNVLDKSTGIDACATLQYDIVPSNLPGSDNGLLCRCLEAESDEWISLAFSKTGGMVGNKAIIYVPGDDTVPKYDIF